VFVEELDAIPDGAPTIFSAHGVTPAVEAEAARRGLRVIDATCPLVAKVHSEGRRFAAQGRTVIVVGHAGHPEVQGTVGQIGGDVRVVGGAADVAALDLPASARVAYVTQTTLSVDDTRATIAAIRARFADAVGPGTQDICYATQNRQAAMRELAAKADVLLVVGARNSSNSNRLVEIGAEAGVPTHLVPAAGELRWSWIAQAETVGITAGASAPEVVVQELIAAIRSRTEVTVSTMAGITEDIRFRLPAEVE
jgi:4-hydroxy-3-methylbut-2-enyl diphosphate reductase